MERRIKENLKKHTHSEQDRRILERVVEVARGEVKRVETMMEAVLSKLADRLKCLQYSVECIQEVDCH